MPTKKIQNQSCPQFQVVKCATGNINHHLTADTSSGMILINFSIATPSETFLIRRSLGTKNWSEARKLRDLLFSDIESGTCYKKAFAKIRPNARPFANPAVKGPSIQQAAHKAPVLIGAICRECSQPFALDANKVSWGPVDQRSGIRSAIAPCPRKGCIGSAMPKQQLTRKVRRSLQSS